MHWILRRSIHSSWLVAVASLSFLSAVWSAQFFSISYGLLAVPAAGLLAFCLWRQKVYVILLVIAASAAIGLVRGSIYAGELDVYKNYYGQTVVADGKVGSDSIEKTAGLQSFSLTAITINDQPMTGSIQVSLSVSQVIRRGDQVRVEGKMTPGFGASGGSLYRAKLVSLVPTGDVAVQVRDWFAAAVRRAIHEPQASLGIGYLVGQKSALPADLTSALQVAGLTHVVVASGYNLTILVRLCRRLLIRVSKYMAAFGSVILMTCFIAVTGMSPSMSRAGLVTGLSLATWYYGRHFHPLVLLPFAAMITVAIQPSYIWNDLGWALSFTAFAGVMIVAPLLQRYFFGDKKPGAIRQILGETIAAHALTAPLIISAFGQLSNVAIFTNLLILPLVPLAMLLTFLSGVGALLLPGIASVIGLPAQWLLDYMVALTNFAANLPWAQSKINLGWVVIVGIYGVIVCACVYLWRVTKLDLARANIVE